MPKPTRYVAKSGAVSWRVKFRIGSGTRSETFATKKDADRFCKLIDAMGGARARAVMNEERGRGQVCDQSFECLHCGAVHHLAAVKVVLVGDGRLEGGASAT